MLCISVFSGNALDRRNVNGSFLFIHLYKRVTEFVNIYIRLNSMMIYSQYHSFKFL